MIAKPATPPTTPPTTAGVEADGFVLDPPPAAAVEVIPGPATPVSVGLPGPATTPVAPIPVLPGYMELVSDSVRVADCDESVVRL